MARRGRRGNYRRVTLSLPKRLYMVLNGIAGGDERLLNRLIRGILEDKLSESTFAELELYIRTRREEEEEVKEESNP